MGTHIIWVHGNAVTVETPENLEPGGIHVGWGTDLTLGNGKGSWFHIPIPVPSLHDGDPVYLKRVFLLYRTAATTQLKSVHIYDGKRLLREFNNLGYDGDHTTNYEGPDTAFPPAERVRVRRGIGVSFFVQGSLGPEVGRTLMVPAAGAEYEVPGPFLITAAKAIAGGFDKLIRRSDP